MVKAQFCQMMGVIGDCALGKMFIHSADVDVCRKIRKLHQMTVQTDALRQSLILSYILRNVNEWPCCDKSFVPMYGRQSKAVVADLGYESSVDIYRAERCCGCPLRCLCYKGKSDRRTIEVNKVSNEYRRRAKELLTSEMRLYHRSMRPIEPEAVFGNLKFNHGFKKFCLKGNEKVDVKFGLVALAHNLRKYAKTLGRTVPKMRPQLHLSSKISSINALNTSVF